MDWFNHQLDTFSTSRLYILQFEESCMKKDTVLQHSKQKELQNSTEINIHLNLRCVFVYCKCFVFPDWSLFGICILIHVFLLSWGRHINGHLGSGSQQHYWTDVTRCFHGGMPSKWSCIIDHKRTKTSCWKTLGCGHIVTWVFPSSIAVPLYYETAVDSVGLDTDQRASSGGGGRGADFFGVCVFFMGLVNPRGTKTKMLIPQNSPIRMNMFFFGLKLCKMIFSVIWFIINDLELFSE